jgi:hypothetical protein
MMGRVIHLSNSNALDVINNDFEKRLAKEISKEKKVIFGRLKDELSARRKKARKKLSDELRASRKRLRELKWKIFHAEQIAEKAIAEHMKEKRRGFNEKLIKTRHRLKHLNECFEQAATAWRAENGSAVVSKMAGGNYPEAPAPSVPATEDGDGIPHVPGIYFFWSGESVVYVGQSRNLNQRVRLNSHHVLRPELRVSFLYFEEEFLTWAECFYIGVLRPQQNFGRSASHFKFRKVEAQP